VNIFLFCPVVSLPPLELLSAGKEFSHGGTESTERREKREERRENTRP
jgi:hypothetical protein